VPPRRLQWAPLLRRLNDRYGQTGGGAATGQLDLSLPASPAENPRRLRCQALGFAVTIDFDDGGAYRAARWALADLDIASDDGRSATGSSAIAPADHCQGTRFPGHSISVRARPRGTATIWADGVCVASRVPPGLVLPMLAWLLNQGALSHPQDLLLFHAGVVANPHGGIAIFGRSGSGKSTLTAALVVRGLSYLSDEVAAFDPSSKQLLAYPKALSLDDAALAVLRSATTGWPQIRPVDEQIAQWSRTEWQIPASSLRPGSTSGSCSARIALFPELRPGAPTALHPMRSSEAMLLLLANSFNFVDEPTDRFWDCVELARTVESYSLVLGDLQTACTTVLDLLDRPAPVSRPGDDRQRQPA